MLALVIISWVFIGIGLLSGIIVYVDINMGRYQGMPIMNIAWPITCLYSGPLGLVMYFKYGRAKKPSGSHDTHDPHTRHSKKHLPNWVNIYISSTHCGAGCGLADIIGEWGIYWIGISFWGHTIWASYFIDFGLALAFGLLFQFFNIMPMKPELGKWEILKDAFKADFWSLSSFQIGMYAWLLAVYFIFSGELSIASPIYWFMMQIGLTIGLLTTYPINYWLIKSGVKVPCAH